MMPHLAIFTRAPRLGRVKRRLAAEIGDMAAMRFHRQTLDALIRRVGFDGRWSAVLAVTPECCRWPRSLPRLGQGRGGLGKRMAHVLGQMPTGPAVLIGSDIPDIGARHIAEAFRALGRAHVVFGPAADGGYWLVGIRDKSLLPGLFRNVRWSTVDALKDTLANMPPDRRYVLLETLDDVDDGAGWRYRRRRAARNSTQTS